MNPTMLEVQRLAILQRAILVGFRVLKWSRMPTLDIVEPQNFRLVTHPLEPRRVIAVILDQVVDSPGISADRRSAYIVWTAAESFRLSDRGHMVGEPRPHSLGRIPFVLVALSPQPGSVVDFSTFSDVIRAHKAVWFENVNLLKESKSATKTTFMTGPTDRTARRQMLDSEGHVNLQDGATATPADLSMDLAPFRDTADHILERAAANHGIPPAVLRGDGASSGYEIELRYIGIRERRIEQEPYFRSIEHEIADLMSVVLASDLPELAFEMGGWSIDFGEIQMPLSVAEELTNFERKRALGLTDTIEETQRLNPDLEGDEDATWITVVRRIARETKRNQLMRPLQQVSGSMGTKQESAPGVAEQGSTEVEDDEDEVAA
jgi:hypothetical protein